MTACNQSETYMKFNASMINILQCFDRSRHDAANACVVCAAEFANLTQTFAGIKSSSDPLCYDIEDEVVAIAYQNHI